MDAAMLQRLDELDGAPLKFGRHIPRIVPTAIGVPWGICIHPISDETVDLRLKGASEHKIPAGHDIIMTPLARRIVGPDAVEYTCQLSFV